jgi:hypothetical protein
MVMLCPIASSVLPRRSRYLRDRLSRWVELGVAMSLSAHGVEKKSDQSLCSYPLMELTRWWGWACLPPVKMANRFCISVAALGRAGQTMTGCLRHGVTTWLVGEVILYEILGAKVMRIGDKQSGFELLETRT